MNEELDRRYHSILEQYSKLLHEWLELSPEGKEGCPSFLPLFPGVAVVRDECPLRESAPDLLRLLVVPGARTDGLRELRNFTSGAAQLTILDPYFFFAGKASQAIEIANDFKWTARIEQRRLKSIHVVRDVRKDTGSVLSSIKQVMKASGVRLRLSPTTALHDRVWIADGVRAVVVGTSFNGLGTRASFILPLPKPDLAAILEFLYSRRLAHRARRGVTQEDGGGAHSSP